MKPLISLSGESDAGKPGNRKLGSGEAGRLGAPRLMSGPSVLKERFTQGALRFRVIGIGQRA